MTSVEIGVSWQEPSGVNEARKCHDNRRWQAVGSNSPKAWAYALVATAVAVHCQLAANEQQFVVFENERH
jgi:hypothetical protein